MIGEGVAECSVVKKAKQKTKQTKQTKQAKQTNQVKNMNHMNQLNQMNQMNQMKQATLERLQRDLAALYVDADWKNTKNTPGDWGAVQEAYHIFCAALHAYLLEHTSTATRELRFYPLAAVAPDSPLVQQGSSHWNASRLPSGHAVCDACGGAHFSGYTELIRAYALDLATRLESAKTDTS